MEKGERREEKRRHPLKRERFTTSSFYIHYILLHANMQKAMAYPKRPDSSSASPDPEASDPGKEGAPRLRVPADALSLSLSLSLGSSLGSGRSMVPADGVCSPLLSFFSAPGKVGISRVPAVSVSAVSSSQPLGSLQSVPSSLDVPFRACKERREKRVSQRRKREEGWQRTSFLPPGILLHSEFGHLMVLQS